MKEEKDILNNLKRADKPSVPEGFFNSFSDKLISKIEEEDSFLENLPKRKSPEVPDGFFTSFSENILQELEPEVKEGKKAKVIPLRIFLAVASVAAVFTFIVLTTKQNTSPGSDRCIPT